LKSNVEEPQEYISLPDPYSHFNLMWEKGTITLVKMGKYGDHMVRLYHGEKVIFRWDDDGLCFVLGHHY
jgi:hypothetical protein